jgi:type II secretion system protein J
MTLRKEHGFTLIEMLVTLTMFSVAVVALVAGLRSGTKAYQSVRRHQAREAELRHAFGVMGNDIRHLCRVAEDIPTLVKQSAQNGEEILTITALSPRNRQRAGIDFDWNKVDYFVDSDEKQGGFMRLCYPQIGNAGVRFQSAPEPELLLPGVREITFQFGTENGLVDAWEEAEKAPTSVNVAMSFEDGRTVTKSMWVPLGALVGEQQ